MATLKTNYKDDLFSGDRKYREIRNSDGTVSFEDVTEYTQTGDVFASADINATNTEVNGINASSAQMNNDILWYGTCTTAAATQAKVATTTDRKLGNLTIGQKVAIKMTNNNTHSTPTLNVDGKGAKSIKAFGTTTPTVWWKAGDVVTFVYDGTNWIMGVTAGEIEQINASLTEKIKQKQGSISSGTYTGIALDWISYDETKKQMILHKKGAGADSVIPFNGGFTIKSATTITVNTNPTDISSYVSDNFFIIDYYWGQIVSTGFDVVKSVSIRSSKMSEAEPLMQCKLSSGTPTLKTTAGSHSVCIIQTE